MPIKLLLATYINHHENNGTIFCSCLYSDENCGFSSRFGLKRLPHSAARSKSGKPCGVVLGRVKPPSQYISTINKRKKRIELIILLAVFGILFAWTLMRHEVEQQAIDRMDREADAYFDSIQQLDSH